MNIYNFACHEVHEVNRGRFKSEQDSHDLLCSDVNLLYAYLPYNNYNEI